MTDEHASGAYLRARGVGDGTTELVLLSGELDLATAPVVDRAVEAALKRGPELLVLDLQGLDFCDCSGLRALLRARLAALAEQRGFRILAPRPTVLRLISMSGCAKLLDPVPPGGAPTAPGDDPRRPPPVG